MRAVDPTTPLARLLDGLGPRVFFQPIVDLDTAHPIGYEALARPLDDSDFADPAALFAAAHAEGRLEELDLASRRAALRAAAAAELPAGSAVFVNVEVATLVAGGIRNDESERLAGADLRLVLELTERDLTARPAELLIAVHVARRAGWRIALDDVGAMRASLALMPLLRPDIVKLDLRLVQRAVGRHTAEVVNAVAAEASAPGRASSPRASRPRRWPTSHARWARLSVRGSCTATRRRCPPPPSCARSPCRTWPASWGRPTPRPSPW